MTHWTSLLNGQRKHRYERKSLSKRYLSFFDHYINGDNQTICGFLAGTDKIFMKRRVWSRYYDLTGRVGLSREKIRGVKGDDGWWIMDVSQLLLDPHTHTQPSQTFSPQKWTWKPEKKFDGKDKTDLEKLFFNVKENFSARNLIFSIEILSS